MVCLSECLFFVKSVAHLAQFCQALAHQAMRPPVPAPSVGQAARLWRKLAAATAVLVAVGQPEEFGQESSFHRSALIVVLTTDGALECLNQTETALAHNDSFVLGLDGPRCL
jgi:hypothetical protein